MKQLWKSLLSKPFEASSPILHSFCLLCFLRLFLMPQSGKVQANFGNLLALLSRRNSCFTLWILSLRRKRWTSSSTFTVDFITFSSINNWESPVHIYCTPLHPHLAIRPFHKCSEFPLLGELITFTKKKPPFPSSIFSRRIPRFFPPMPYNRLLAQHHHANRQPCHHFHCQRISL